MDETFLRTESLIGADGVARLQNASVAVFGIGGVGSYAAEALCRSGVGTLHLFDGDRVAQSNLNRQLIATVQTVGQPKTAAAYQRLISINPQIKVIEHFTFVTPETPIDFDRFDYIIDAVDNVTVKLFLIEMAREKGIPLISVMGTGNKMDPTRLKVSDIADTSICPLARVMRKELKKRGIEHQQVIWSDEKPLIPADLNGHRQTGRPNPGSMAMVPGTAGLIAAAQAVETLLYQPK